MAAQFRLRGVTPTPLEPAPDAVAVGADVWLKREDVHELGAFKWRGALPAMRAYRDAGAGTVVTASTGNHGAAAAWAARRLDMRAVVYVPEGTARAKLDLLAGQGGDVRRVGSDLDEAKDAAVAFAEAEGLPFFADGAEPVQYAGYAAIADEICDALDRPPAAVIVPVGNGALLGGIGMRLAERSPDTLRVGVVAAAAPVMADCWEAGAVVVGAGGDTFADGMAVRVAIPYAVEVLASAAQRMVRVSERELATAVGDLAGAGLRVEASGAAALAGLRRLDLPAGPVVLVVTGRNIDPELHRRAVTDPGSFPG
jgi:threonine dehydratase